MGLPEPSTDMTHALADLHKGAIVHLIDALQSHTQHGQLVVDYYVDEEGHSIKSGQISKLINRIASAKKNGRQLLLVSGPTGFIEFWAGKKEWIDGHEVQGPLAGKLGQMNLQGWQVLKF